MCHFCRCSRSGQRGNGHWQNKPKQIVCLYGFIFLCVYALPAVTQTFRNRPQKEDCSSQISGSCPIPLYFSRQFIPYFGARFPFPCILHNSSQSTFHIHFCSQCFSSGTAPMYSCPGWRVHLALEGERGGGGRYGPRVHHYHYQTTTTTNATCQCVPRP